MKESAKGRHATRGVQNNCMIILTENTQILEDGRQISPARVVKKLESESYVKQRGQSCGTTGSLRRSSTDQLNALLRGE